MVWRAVLEQAAVGFFGYGTLSIVLSKNPVAFILASLFGALVQGLYVYLKPLPWRRYFLSKSKKACVSVTRDLRFYKVSTKSPEKFGFIRISDLDKDALFDNLNGKRLDPETVPFHIKVAMEERREIEIPWAVLEPHLRSV